jgi:hypothetical protein
VSIFAMNTYYKLLKQEAQYNDIPEKAEMLTDIDFVKAKIDEAVVLFSNLSTKDETDMQTNTDSIELCLLRSSVYASVACLHLSTD